MIIQAYKSRITGKIFENVDKYRNHHRTALIHKKYQDLYHKRRIKFTKSISNFRETVCKISDVEQWMVDNSTRLAKHFDIERLDVNGKLIHYEITKCRLTVNRKEIVSNGYCCPLNGGIQNWKRDEDKPIGYPGWYGRLSFGYIGNLDVFPSDIFTKVGIYAGGGGGSGYNYSCEVSMFDDDWPALKAYGILSQ